MLFTLLIRSILKSFLNDFQPRNRDRYFAKVKAMADEMTELECGGWV